MPINRSDAIKKASRICSKACERITNKYGSHSPAFYFPETERTVILVWTATGIIENGGFLYLFSSVLPGDPNCTFTIDAFIRIGCLKAAKSIKNAICLFPECEPHTDKLERIRWFESQPEEVRNRLDIEFWDELDNITISLADYIRVNELDEKYI